MRSRILLVEDDSSFAEVFKSCFATKKYQIIWAKTAAEGFKNFTSSEFPIDVVVIDYRLPDLSGEELAEAIKKRGPKQQLLFSTGDLTLSTVQLLLETGLSNGFIPKGIANSEIQKKVDGCIQTYRSTTRFLVPEIQEDQSEIEKDLKSINIVSRSPKMHQVFKKVQNYQDKGIDVLILGESGVGKEIVAKALAIPGQPFFPVNCANYSESSQFLESELFGHAKGAYTDAKEDKLGIFEQADGGIIFLDELHTLSLPSQSKLLRVLQEKKIRRLGENKERELKNCRVVVATKPNLLQMVDEGTFNFDLYQRINTAIIQIPRLSDRLEDLEPLVAHFSALYSAKYKVKKYFESSTLTEFEKYHWPGNVRELENMIERLVCDVPHEVIKADHVQSAFAEIRAITNNKTKKNEEQVLGLDLAKKNFEKLKIIVALKKSWSQKEAASCLGMPRTTLLSRMERLGIDPNVYLLT